MNKSAINRSGSTLLLIRQTFGAAPHGLIELLVNTVYILYICIILHSPLPSVQCYCKNPFRELFSCQQNSISFLSSKMFILLDLPEEEEKLSTLSFLDYERTSAAQLD